MKSFFKKVLPKKISDVVAIYRLHKRSIARAKKLQESKHDLSSEHLQACKILPDRNALLKLMPKGMVCAEVGVAEGDFSRAIFDLMSPSHLHLIDLWHSGSARYSASMEIAYKKMEKEITSKFATVHRGLSWDKIAELPTGSIDWFYLDAAHDYEFIKRDLEAVFPKLSKDSWVCGHDYTPWSSNGLNRWGVVEAVNEFCIDKNWGFAYLTNETHRHISFALRPLEKLP